jgi:hypothetical protein
MPGGYRLVDRKFVRAWGNSPIIASGYRVSYERGIGPPVHCFGILPSELHLLNPPPEEEARGFTLMSEREKDTEFLRQCIVYDDSAERHKLDESITRLQRNERCVRRAVGLMALLIALALAGVCYASIFLGDYPHNITQFITPYVVKIFWALGGASLICILAFGGLGLVYRKELDQRREECRQLARKLLETRGGKPSIIPLSVAAKDREEIGGRSEATAPALKIVTLPKGLPNTFWV